MVPLTRVPETGGDVIANPMRAGTFVELALSRYNCILPLAPGAAKRCSKPVGCFGRAVLVLRLEENVLPSLHRWGPSAASTCCHSRDSIFEY